jgi:hypothetical protein
VLLRAPDLQTDAMRRRVPVLVGLAVLAAAVAGLTLARPWAMSTAGDTSPAVAGPPDRLLLPAEAPLGYPLRSVGDGDDPGRPKRTSTSTVYGDSSAADPLQRPHLVALWQGGSETAIPLPGSPATGPDAPGFRQVEVQGSPGAVGRVGDDI